jgi:hypothetical protein
MPRPTYATNGPTIAQAIQVVSPLLNLIEALCQVLRPVVATSVGILDGMRQIGLNRQRIKVKLINQHGSGAARKPCQLCSSPTPGYTELYAQSYLTWAVMVSLTREYITATATERQQFTKHRHRLLWAVAPHAARHFPFPARRFIFALGIVHSAHPDQFSHSIIRRLPGR